MDEKKYVVMGKTNFRIPLCLILILIIVFGAFYPCLKNGFVNWDDDKYLGETAAAQPFSLAALKDTFTSFSVGHYQPLTILSYLFDYQFFKLKPFGYHLTNLILHLLNCLLVFWFIYLLSRNLALSFLTSLLFAIHPLRVESVVWISERKDVLYAFFYLSALISYLYYLFKEKNSKFYLLSLFLFLCSLLSKSMAVTLPLILLLLDYYLKRKPERAVLLDKIPFFILTLLSSLIVVFGIILFGGIRPGSHYSFLSMLSVASYAIVFYLTKLFLPLKLSCLYPFYNFYYNFQYNPLYLYSILTVILLALIVILSVKYTKKLLFGSAFFLITLLPVLQFIPNSTIIVADRYTYLSSIGIIFILSTLFYWLYSRKLKNPLAKSLLIALIIFIILSLSILTYNRCKVWKDGITLWSDALKNYPSVTAYNSRGTMFFKKGQYEKAYDDFIQGIKIGYADKHIFKNQAYFHTDLLHAIVNLANVQDALGKKEDAIATLKKAIELNPYYADPYFNLGTIYYSLGEKDKAVALFKMAIEKEPNNPGAYYALGAIYDHAGNKEESLKWYWKATEIDSTYVEAYNNLASIYAEKGQTDKAIEVWNRIIEINPDFAIAHFNLAKAYFYQKKYDLAIYHCDKVLKLGNQVDPKFLDALKPHRK
jgi:tetratricopeptide (TPR) repeat protein